METLMHNKAGSILKSILFCAVFILVFVIFSFARNFFPANPSRLLHGVMGTVAAFLTTFLFLKFDNKSFSDIGLYFERKTIVRFVCGVLIGITLMGTLVITVFFFTQVRIEHNSATSFLNFLGATASLLPLAFMEEMGFRAYPLQLLKETKGVIFSVILSSVLFALYHIVNGWTITSSFFGAGIWGLIFGLSAIYSKGIAMPTGIHYAANLTTSAFGSGNNSVGLWTIKQTDTSINKDQIVDWTVVIPAMILFVIALVCIKLYMRGKLPLTRFWQNQK